MTVLYANQDISAINSTLFVDGDFTIDSGNCSFKSADVEITGDFTINAGVVFNSQAVSGAIFEIAGNLSWTGIAGALLDLRSIISWYLTVGGTAVCSYVNVSNSDASGGSTIYALDGTSTDSGENTNWLMLTVADTDDSINTRGRPSPAIMFMVDTLDYDYYLPKGSPGTLAELDARLRQITVYIPGIDVPLKYGDTFVLYGQQAVRLRNTYEMIRPRLIKVI